MRNHVSFDPYHHLGLKRNPFFAPESLVIGADRWLDFGYSVAPSPKQQLFIQIIGQKGAGKTSHLLHWQQQTGGEYFYQPPWNWRPHLPIGAIAYWDEANRIPLPRLMVALWQAYRQGATIVAASHWDLKPMAQMMGFPVKTLHLATLNPDSLQAWIQVQLSSEQLFPDKPVVLPLAAHEVAEVIDYSQGSWRAASSYLHRWLAQQAREQHSTSLHGQ